MRISSTQSTKQEPVAPMPTLAEMNRPQPGHASDATAQPLATVVAGCSYAALVVIMWVPFNLYAGLPFETSFPYMSETSSIGGGFLYIADPLRVHTNTFYHLSYLIGEALGIGGSYVPYQCVYAALW